MTEKQIVEAIVEAYTSVYGAEKWEALTAQEQHDVVMVLVKDMLRA